MSYCHNCGSHVQKAMVFCVGCGTKLIFSNPIQNQSSVTEPTSSNQSIQVDSEAKTKQVNSSSATVQNQTNVSTNSSDKKDKSFPLLGSIALVCSISPVIILLVGAPIGALLSSSWWGFVLFPPKAINSFYGVGWFLGILAIQLRQRITGGLAVAIAALIFIFNLPGVSEFNGFKSAVNSVTQANQTSKEKWEKFGNSSNGTVYIDANSIRKNGRYVNATGLIDLRMQRHTSNKLSYYSMKSDTTFDCKGMTITQNSSVMFSDKMGSGSIVEKENVPFKYSPNSDTVGYDLLIHYCK